MSDRDLRCKPRNLSERQWWYEEPGGICVVVRSIINGRPYTTCTDISWRALRAALKRKDK